MAASRPPGARDDTLAATKRLLQYLIAPIRTQWWRRCILPAMGNAWITLVATLAGTVVGSVAAYANQAAQWRRQQRIRWDTARLETFVAYMGRASSYYVALRHLAWALRKDRSLIRERRDQAEELLPSLLAAKAQVDIIAEGPVVASADRLLKYLRGLNTTLYAAERDPATTVKSGGEYDKEYNSFRDQFTSAAQTTLRME